MMAGHLALLSIGLAGCVLQGGGFVGHNIHLHGVPDRISYGGALQSRLAAGGGAAHTYHLGFELQGRAEEELGSLPLLGWQGGVTLWPENSVSFAPSLDFGVPAGWNNRVGGLYYGASFELPLRLYARTDASEINRNYRFLDTEGSLVPFLRLRRYSLALSGTDPEPGYEIALGLSVRTEVVTDLIDLRHLF